ncbi:hypothetical protein L195_g037284 [Trifolium pratense]|uniref:Uncharacterized protein n=1 Tax=Trifolium pratense TaxID=57577 RepID=A0A2K3LRX6_TRIPR|nr:hypothetical protein L195_g037284 [Trifolium pratense]
MQGGKRNSGGELIRRRVSGGISIRDETAPPQESSGETELRLKSEIPIGKTTKFVAARFNFIARRWQTTTTTTT